MLKKLLIVGVIALAIDLGVRQSRSPQTLAKPAKIAVPPTAEKLSAKAKAAIDLDLPLPPAKTSDIDCEDGRKAFFDHSVSQLFDKLKGNVLTLNPDCTPAILGFDVKTCVRAVQSPHDESKARACQNFLMMARSRLVEKITADWDHYESMEMSVLVNKIVALLTREKPLTSAERLEWRQMTEALVTRNPENAEAIKVHLMTFLTDQAADSMAGDSEIWAWVERGLEITPDDPQLRELYLFNELQKDDALTRLKARTGAQPGEGLTHYYLAVYYWRTNDRASTVNELALAVKGDPQNQRYQDSLLRARDPKTSFDEKIFGLQLGFNWDQL